MKLPSICAYVLALAAAVSAQTTSSSVTPLLERQIQPPEVTVDELQRFLLQKAPPLSKVSTAEAWSAEAGRLRREVLRNIFHGWPREWVEAPLKVEDLGLLPSGPGYRIRKLRYEIVPGFSSVALLYEPAELRGKAPAILNVNGHSDPGKGVEWKQKRCINQALRGMLALNLEWIYFGELKEPGNEHWFGAHLDLVGANAAGLFYLAMRKGLDYLYQHPHADQQRIGMTGLSGGGWQTILLSSLDERIAVSIPVAGYSAVRSRIERGGDIGDIEQNPTDMLTIADYSHLTAMRAPRPTLLIYNAEDNCCFRGPLVKPYTYDAIVPFFRLFGAADRLSWHLNTDPSDHNYQLDNREQAYRFLARHFGLPPADREIPVDNQIKSPEELVVGLPENNLTILGLARELASGMVRPAGAPVAELRSRLRGILRLRPVTVAESWAVTNTHAKGLETRSYRLRFDNGLSSTALWLRALQAGEPAPATLVLHDKGRRAAGAMVSDRVNRGEQVLALDLLFTGDAAPRRPPASGFTQMLAAVGERPLGMEAAQLIAAARWLKQTGAATVRLESSGIRSQVVSLVAAALEPGLFAEVVVQDGMKSLRHLLDAPIKYEEAPDLFCLDLYKQFDLDGLQAMQK